MQFAKLFPSHDAFFINAPRYQSSWIYRKCVSIPDRIYDER